ncbi:STAS domain-containing protein [Actinomadura parmotrematis]|uniref:Anti-sigma factor antagonist n=1 Tax=Actinomadura parmotrematis TaxID=2864039 RepID=A0ABS7FUQ8_9ACTN|nr:STAS domain-containing protein [Actinomadura parmotrematis]MBW8484145.1 STAS domain-containing protein [Actinomadura parmotrematis]
MTLRELSTDLRRYTGGFSLVTVTGELDYGNAVVLSSALDEVSLRTGGGLVLDLAELTYCDSTGITVFISAYKRAVASGARFALAAPNPDLARVLGIIGLDDFFALHADADEAMRAMLS